MIKSYKEVAVGDFSISVDEEVADMLQEELDQVLVLMGLTDMRLDILEEQNTDVNYSLRNVIEVKAKGENKGWWITFSELLDTHEVRMSVIAKMTYSELSAIKIELREKYVCSILDRLGGLTVLNNVNAMIELLQKIKYKI